MRYPILLSSLVLIASAAFGADEWKPLWNGKDFSGWDRWLGKPHPSTVLAGEPKDEKGNYPQVLGDRDPLNVFTVVSVDGKPAIHITGQVFGGITTREEFSNYHLRLQFKWGVAQWPPREKPGTQRDSGLLYHVHSAMNFNNRTWPRSIEFQIQERDVGDLYAIGAKIFVPARKTADTPRVLYTYDPTAELIGFLEERPIGNRCIKFPDHEKPSGEWNTLDLVCLGDESIHIVNGQVVMRLSKAQRLDGPAPATLTKGKILLQSEGAEVFYRDIALRPITAVPAEFAKQ